MPAAHPEDWAYAYVWLPNTPSAYGPLWALLTWPVVTLAGTSISALIGGYKLLSLAGYAACCWLIWSALPEEDQSGGVALFAWSPLVLFEVLGKAHNDILLAVASLVAIRVGSQRGLIASTAGALGKLSGTVVLLAVSAPLLRQRRWRALTAGLSASAILVAVAYLPFWQGPQTLVAFDAQTNWLVWSPASVLVTTGMEPLHARLLLGLGWVGVCGLILRRDQHIATAAAWPYIASVLLLTTHVFAHYLVPVVALAAVSSNSALQRTVLALSIGTLAAYAVEPLQLAMTPGWRETPSFVALGTTVLLAPLLLVWLSEIRSGRRNYARSTPGDARRL